MGVSSALISVWEYYGWNNNKKMFFLNKHWQRHIQRDGKYAVNINVDRHYTFRIFPNKFSIPFEWSHTTDIVLHNVEPVSF